MQKLIGCSVGTVENFVANNNGKCIDAVEDVLLDNVVYSFSFGTMFCFVDHLNEWSSGYNCYFFSKYHERGIKKMWDRFNALKAGIEE